MEYIQHYCNENGPIPRHHMRCARLELCRSGGHPSSSTWAKLVLVYHWHRRFVHVRPNLEEMEAELDEQSTSDELVPSQRPQSPSMVHTGFWRLNMDLHPVNRHFGWVLGKGRWNTRDSHLNTVTGGGIDILLTANIKEPLLRGRHARLLLSLESYTFMVAADKKLRVGDCHLNPTNVSAFGQRKTVIAFGDLEYELAFMNLD